MPQVIWLEASYLFKKVVALPLSGVFHHDEAMRFLESERQLLHKKQKDSAIIKQETTATTPPASFPFPLYFPDDEQSFKQPGTYNWQEVSPSFLNQKSKIRGLNNFVRIKDRAFEWVQNKSN